MIILIKLVSSYLTDITPSRAVFGNDVCPCAERDVANSYDVGASLCDEGAIHHCALALHHYGKP